MAFLPLKFVNEHLSGLVSVDEKQYNQAINDQLIENCNFQLVDCHEYGEAYFYGDILMAFHEIECIGHATHYLRPEIIK